MTTPGTVDPFANVHDPFAAPGALTPTGSTPIVRTLALEKFFGTNHVLRGVTFEVYPRETICIIGRSGSGKSTLLRCINFLEEPTVGAVEVDGLRVIADPLHARDRSHREQIRQIRMRAQMVFQEFNLFPHLKVIDNLIEGPVRVKGVARDEAIATAERYLDKVGLAEKRDEYPARLSGGQKQRVAIARALTMEPKVLLFDEPTSALDPTLVGEVINVMEELAHEGATMIVVTHEMAFAREAADRVYFVEEGVFVEAGPPEQVIDNPKDPRTRDFLARTLGEAHVHEGGQVHQPDPGALHLHADEGPAHARDHHDSDDRPMSGTSDMGHMEQHDHL
jgi:ABC-type polar amino acid transport system ATPase subunit